MSRLEACLVLFAVLVFPPAALPQAAIRYDAAAHVWQMTAGVNDQHSLQTMYWAPRLEGPSSLATPRTFPEAASFDPPGATTPLEYSGWGGGLTTQPALKISFPDGNRSLLLDYPDSKQLTGPDGDQLEISLPDRLTEVYVHLFYKVYAQGILARWSKIENRTKGTITVSLYKTVRSTVQEGALYRLIPPETSERAAVEYVGEGGHQAVLFAFLHSQHYGEPFQTVHLQGLEPKALYRVKPLDLSKAPGLPQQMTGSELMGLGLSRQLVGDYDSTAVVFEKID